MRPLLHLSLNILDQHPGLRLTMLVAPSTLARVSGELGSPALTHIHRPSSRKDGALIDRLQLVPVQSGELDVDGMSPIEQMSEEGANFAGALPAFLRTLFAKQSSFGHESSQSNKFAALRPSFAILDVRLCRWQSSECMR